MAALVYSRATLVWLLLILLTLLSWTMAVGHGVGLRMVTSLIIIVIAVFKIRLVGLYFMELRNAPVVLRGAYEAYCVAVLVILSVGYAYA
jgi:heme/copper-type cytochrome/quinol oxidase subunit 4